MLWGNRKTKKRVCAVLAAMLALTSFTGGTFAGTKHDELDYYLEVRGKRTTITVKPNATDDGSGNNYVISPDSTGSEGVSDAFTVERPVGSSVVINSGSADAGYIDYLEESDPDNPNVTGFTYSFGVEGETVTVHWKPFTTYFDGNQGTPGEASKTTEYNQTNTMPGATRSGYDFAGWFTDASGGTKAGTQDTTYTQPGQEQTFYAHWTCNHSKPPHGRTTSAGGWAYSDGVRHRRLISVKCGTCGTALSGENYYQYANCSDSNNDGKCDTCGHYYGISVTYTLKYKKTSGASTTTKTQSGVWNSLRRTWISENFENLGMSSNHNWYKGNWKGKSGAVNTGCASVNQLAAAGYLTGTYYKEDY